MLLFSISTSGVRSAGLAGSVVLRLRFLLNALVMIVNGHGQGFLRVFLADAIKVQLPFDFRRFGNGEFRLFFLVLELQFAVEDVFAKDDAVVADVNARPGDELAHFRVRLAAETAHREIVGARHANSNFGFWISTVLVVDHATTEVFSTAPGISLRDCTT